MEIEMGVLLAFIVFGILTIFAFIQAQSYITTTSSTPEYQANQCSPDQALYAWIWNLSPNGVCPPYSNNLVVKNNILYQKSFISDNDTGCCYFSENNLSVVILPGVLIGVTYDGPPPTDNALNEKPYTTVDNYISYIVPFCDLNSTCIEYSLVSRAGANGTYTVIKYSVPNADTQSINDLQTAELIVTNIDSTFTLNKITVANEQVYPGPVSGQSQAIQDIVSTFNAKPPRIYPIPTTRPS